MNMKSLKHTLFENVETSNGIFTKHFHDTYTIGITHDGFFKSINLNKECLVYKKTTRIINPGEVHSGNSKAWKYTNFYPTISLLEEMYEEMYFEKKIPLFEKHIANDIKLYNLLFKLFKSVYGNFDSMKIEINLINALSYLIKNYSSVTKDYNVVFPDKKIMTNSLEYINDCLESSISLDNLANNAALSKFHFLRVFKKNVGLTPHHYILTRKVQKARDLIIEGSSLSQAGFSMGFADQSHFIRNFKKIYGYSPKALLKKNNFIFYP